MTTKTSKHLITAAAAAAIFAMAGIVHADDGDGGELLAVSYIAGDDGGAPASCNALREAARFEVEMKRTDGDVSPEAPAITCRDEVFAQVEADSE